MRVLNIGTKRFTKVLVLDDPRPGGACHEYEVLDASVPNEAVVKPYGKVSFQYGPIKENGINGCHHEDLLAIVIDRLQHFQKGDFRCRENAIALTKLEEAMLWLNKRTQTRQDQGVEGLNKVHAEA